MMTLGRVERFTAAVGPVGAGAASAEPLWRSAAATRMAVEEPFMVRSFLWWYEQEEERK